MKRCVPLEPEAEVVCEKSSACPRIYQLPPSEGRQVLEEAQNIPVYKYPANIDCLNVDTGKWGKVKVYVLRPERVDISANVIYYIHGAGWVFGSFHTHEKLVRELAARTNSVVVFPEYSRSPEAKYPVALEQCYLVMGILPRIVQEMNLQMNMDTITVAGDSVGGNMAVSMALMSKYRDGPNIQKLLLYYPVTDACFDTKSYHEFAEGYYLYREGMEWFWDQYTTSQNDREQVMASPLRATCEQLSDLPDTMILNGEADVLRDEGEALARKLRESGVEVTAVRYQAMIHDFVMLNALDQTKACRAAMDASVSWLCRKNKGENLH